MRSLYASSGLKAEGVRITIRGDGDQGLVVSKDVRQGPSYSPNSLVNQSATLKEWSLPGCKRAEHKTHSPLEDRWVILATSQVFHYFLDRREVIRFTFDPLKITIEDRVSDNL